MTERQSNILVALCARQSHARRDTGRAWLPVSVLDAYDARSWRGLVARGHVRFLDTNRIQVTQ
jgi:hypothetical protein